MVVEKQTESSNLPDVEVQSGLVIIAKERVCVFLNCPNRKFFD